MCSIPQFDGETAQNWRSKMQTYSVEWAATFVCTEQNPSRHGPVLELPRTKTQTVTNTKSAPMQGHDPAWSPKVSDQKHYTVQHSWEQGIWLVGVVVLVCISYANEVTQICKWGQMTKNHAVLNLDLNHTGPHERSLPQHIPHTHTNSAHSHAYKLTYVSNTQDDKMMIQ